MNGQETFFYLARVLDGWPIDDLSLPLLHDHVEEGLPEVVVDAAVANDLVSEEDQPQVVNVLAVVLLHVDAVHVHQDVADHDHGGLVVGPGGVQGLQEVVVERREHVGSNLGLQMRRHYFLESGVQPLSVLVQDHRVGVSIELLKAEPGIVLPLDLLDGVFQKLPDVLDELLVHGHGESTDPHFSFLLRKVVLHHLEAGLPQGSCRNEASRDTRMISVYNFLLAKD